MFFGLLRRSNVLVPQEGFNPEKHLRREDLVFTRQGLRVRIRWTKTIQFREREMIIPYPWIRSSPLCPTQAVFNAFQLSKNAPKGGPALVMDSTQDPVPLTPKAFIDAIRNGLRVTGEDVRLYAGHSFRRGGATWAFTNQVDIDTIHILGDWKSNAYTSYILPTDSGLLGATTRMLQATQAVP